MYMAKILNLFLVWSAKLGLFVIVKFKLGFGGTLPGHFALSINKHFIGQMFKYNPQIKIVLVAGTNGKTTSTKLIKYLLEKNDYKVISNETGANLVNGIASKLISHSDWKGHIDADVAVFEIDEYMLGPLVTEVSPEAILVLNLFRDQLDRYGEVNAISNRWKKIFADLPKETKLFLNGDDPELYYLGQHAGATVYYFGLAKKLMKLRKIPHDADSIYCPQCNEKLSYSAISYSHLGDFNCKNCGFAKEKVETLNQIKLQSNLFGQYSKYNINGLSLMLNQSFHIKYDNIIHNLAKFKPAFGRQERLNYKNKDILILLSKNPTGFNQSIEAVSEFENKNVNILLILNDQIPDGKDISWIWDVDFQKILPLAKKIFIAGERGYDMAIRLRYELDRANWPKAENGLIKIDKNIFVLSSIKKAVNFAANNTEKNQTLFILPNYSAMLKVRSIILNREML